MNLLFADILPPSTPTPISAVVEQVAATITKSPSHHPENPAKSRAPGTTRLGLPAPRMNPWQRNGRTMLAEAMTDPDAAICQAGLDWTVERVDLRCADTLDPVPEFSAIRRSDTNGLLGVVGKDYSPFQNQAMFDVFKDLAAVGRRSCASFRPIRR